MSDKNEQVKVSNPLAVRSQEEGNPEASNAAALDDLQKASVSFANNAIIVTEHNEVIHSGPDNTLISLCRDRPAEIGTGKQYELAGAIYICAGASQGIINKTPTDSSGQIQKANRNFNLDASSIYMTANGDIDKYYGLTSGGMGNADGSAAIAVKSTNLRFIARNGVKIITGTDLTNENLSKISSFVGVELIAGNDSRDLQPMVKADNLKEALRHLKLRIEKINATLESFATIQNGFNDALTSHTHPDIINMIVGIVAANGLNKVTDGRTLGDPIIKAVGELTTGFIDETIIPDCTEHREKLTKFVEKYMGGTEKEDISSRYHKVN